MRIASFEKTLREIDQLQHVSLHIYGKYDLQKSLIWMTEEMGEVISAIRKSHSKEDISGELGDLMAWIFCLGNILEIPLSESIQGTFHKEINRQLNTYGKLKYDHSEGRLFIGETGDA